MLAIGLQSAAREQAAIARRQQMEDERKQRIFNAKARTIGIDKQALDAQIELKKQREEQEKERDLAYHQQMVMYEQIIQQQESEAERLKAEEKARMLEFWKTQQQPHMRKEYDLNNPHTLRIENPARADVDIDSGLGPASMQQFAGEDNSNVKRTVNQRAQVRDWVKQQVSEKQSKLDQAREEERLYQLQQIELSNRALEMEQSAERARREMARATAEYNLALAREKKEREREKAIDDVCDAMEEIKTNLESDLLTENPKTAHGLFGKTVVANYKGMSPEELEAIRREQEFQVQEKQRLKNEELDRHKSWERYNAAVNKAVIKTQVEIEREREREQRQLLSELQRQNKEKAERDARERVLNTNQPTDDYFKQFGTTTR